MTDPMAQPKPLDVEFPCTARYSHYTRMVVMDAFIEAETETSVVGIEDFLGRLWNRGFKVVPNGDGQWSGDDNA